MGLFNKNKKNKNKNNKQQSVQTSLENMGLTSDKMNSVITNLQSMITCDSDCQKRQQIDDLRNKWMAAKNNLATAPENVQSTEKAYYVLDKGEVAYKQMLVDRYTKIANTNKINAEKNHKLLLDELKTFVKDYYSQTIAYNRVKELLKVRLNENKALKEAIDKNISAVQTNDRRVVYEDWAQQWVYTVKKLFIILYVVIVIVFLYTGSFYKNKGYMTIKGWISVILFVAFPFIVYYITLFIYYIKDMLQWYKDNKAPKDVYTKSE